MSEAVAQEYIFPASEHNRIVRGVYMHRGYAADEAELAAQFSELTARHGVKTHNAIKALHLDELFGSAVGGCKPGAAIEELPTRFAAVSRWNANRKLGQAVGAKAMVRAMELADQFGVGTVVVDNAFHYLWGGGYVINAARKGYIAYTNCTAALAEVVPFGGRFPTLGTNPHSWAFPTTNSVGFPICIDWATSTVAMGRVQQFAREKKPLGPGWAVDAEGKETTDPQRVAALLPFAGHKGYGLSLIDELLAAYIGGSLPTIRSRPSQGSPGEKHTCCFYFQCIRPEALACDNFALGRNMDENVKAVIADIRGHGNENVLLPGEPEARALARSERLGGLLFTAAEIDAFAAMAAECGEAFDRSVLKPVLEK
jgi:LDH2 family malate/lactate/ureidoglycolate dehydrogenase